MSSSTVKIYSWFHNIYISFSKIFMRNSKDKRNAFLLLSHFSKLKKKQHKAMLTIKYLKNFSLWPIATAKNKIEKNSYLQIQSNLVDIQSIYREKHLKAQRTKTKTNHLFEVTLEEESWLVNKNS